MLSATSRGLVPSATCLIDPSGKRRVSMEDSSVRGTDAARPYNGPADNKTRTPCLAFAYCVLLYSTLNRETDERELLAWKETQSDLRREGYSSAISSRTE